MNIHKIEKPASATHESKDSRGVKLDIAVLWARFLLTEECVTGAVVFSELLSVAGHAGAV